MVILPRWWRCSPTTTIGAFFGGLFEWTGGTLRPEAEEVFADEVHGVVLVRESARQAEDGALLDVRETHLFRFRDGQVAEFWDLPAASQRSIHDDSFSETP
jgi:ketosteroid isomerase-like protein